MSHLEALLVNVRDVPDLSELGKPRLKQPDGRRITIQIQVADFARDKRYGNVRLGRDARIGAAIADVSDLEAATVAILEKVDPIIRRQATDLEIDAK